MRRISLLIAALFVSVSVRGQTLPAPVVKPALIAPSAIKAAAILRGADVYHGDGTCDFAKAYNAGLRFCYIKATQGTPTIDPAFVRNVWAARAAGLYVGCYHYFTPTGNGSDQANYFLRALKSVGTKGLMVPALDLEDAGTMTPEQYSASALAFVRQVEQTLGRGCLIYSYPCFIQDYLRGDIACYPLWYAAYQCDPPTAPAPWAKWLVWQSCDHGTWPGIGSGTVDLDQFATGTNPERYLLH
jgi:lysozyme